MRPLRMCMVCRGRFEKQDLIRMAATESGAVIDMDGKHPGRGAYVCKSSACRMQARKRRIVERAFSCKIDAAIYDSLENMEDPQNER